MKDRRIEVARELIRKALHVRDMNGTKFRDCKAAAFESIINYLNEANAVLKMGAQGDNALHTITPENRLHEALDSYIQHVLGEHGQSKEFCTYFADMLMQTIDNSIKRDVLKLMKPKTDSIN